MKKIVTMFLTLALCMGLAVPAFAAENSDTFALQCGDSVTISNFVEKQVKTILYNGEMKEVTGFVVDKDTVISFNVTKESTYADVGKATLESDGYWDEAGLYRNSEYGWEPVQAYEFLTENESYDMGVVYLRNPDSGWDEFQYGFDAKDRLSFLFYLAENEPAGESRPVTPNFTDVAADAYYADAVAWAVSEGITAGTTTTTFSPNSTCTTAQILTFLWRANGSPAPAGSNTTVPAGKYYTDAANWALEKGLTDSFDADTPATRAATVTYLWKLAGAPAADSAAFADVAADATYASAVAWAVKEGITAGTSASTFSPDNTCTRGQIVTFLYRDAFGESTGENSSSNNQTVTPNAGGNSYEQDISALMAEGYTREEAHEILELMAGGYSEESAKDAVRMTEEELEQQQKDFEEWVESVGGSYDPETGAFWVP